MTFLTRTAIVLDTVVSEVMAPDRGGVATFLGIVRDHHQDRAVRGIEYSAYEPMAEATCEAIVGEATSKWPVRVRLLHRLGSLEVGDVAVAIAVAGPHREEAFAACRYVIEEVKRRVPIWKHERYADGTEAWVNPTGQSSAPEWAGSEAP